MAETGGEGDEEMAGVRGRFAPSPSGRMHLGNLFSALLAWLAVRSAGGELVLRIEDLDPDRCREEYARQLADDLRWLGLDWDEGYEKGGDRGPYRQSERTGLYAEAFETLRERGLVYPCYCTRAERLAASAPHGGGEGGRETCRCAFLTEGERRELEERGRRPAWRVRTEEERIWVDDGHMGRYEEVLRRDCGDFILRRSDGVYAYQLAVVTDDAAMGISQVVRGRDLLSSTPRQQYLYRLLGLPEPKFYHVPLLTAPDGRRLSKRDGDLDVGALRAAYSPQEVVGALAFLAGQLERPEAVSPGELVSLFRWDRVGGEDRVADPKQLFRR